jgi:hypothetical protein
MSFYKVVVARYKEDVDWLLPLQDSVVLFNKSDQVPPMPYRQLPNIGRESHTYLTYILENYDNLPEVVVFTQANVSDHLMGNHHQKLIKLANEARVHGVSQNHGVWKQPYGWRIASYKGQLTRAEKPFGKWFEENVHHTFAFPQIVYWGAIFAVRRDRILGRPRSYYENLLKFFQVLNPEEGHYMERSWYYVFKKTVERKAIEEQKVMVARATSKVWLYTIIAISIALVITGKIIFIIGLTKRK